MKKFIFFAAIALLAASCSNENDIVPQEEQMQSVTTRTMTFRVQGDFVLSNYAMTRSALQADGKDMTDVWVLDYDDSGNLLQQVHQDDNTADDFGSPTLELSMGDHNLYFVASRGQNPTLNTETKTLSFTKVLDTFWKSLSITVSSGGTENRNVALDRVVTKIKMTFTDAMPEGIATVSITPGVWYYGMNYTTGAPTAAANSHAVTLSIPGSSVGKTGESANVYGFSSTTQWTTSLSVVSKDGENATIGTASIASAPFLRNRVTEYTGKLWTQGSGLALSLNATWADSYEGSW